MLKLLAGLLPGILSRLESPPRWEGLLVSDEKCSYVRLNCREEVLCSTPPLRLLPALHAFEEPGYYGALHNHRFRFAVLPFGLRASEADLYDMEWQVREGEHVRERGHVTLRTGDAYAIESPIETYHSVKSLRPHYSVTLSDVTKPPVRDNRLTVEWLGQGKTLEVLDRIRDAARQLSKLDGPD